MLGHGGATLTEDDVADVTVEDITVIGTRAKRSSDMRPIANAALALGILSLAACGGGGGGSPTLSDREIEELGNDPRVIGLEQIVERADVLVSSALHADTTLSVRGQTVHEHTLVRVSCSGTRCTSNEGETLTLNDLLNPAIDIDLTAVTISDHGDFATVDVDARIDLPGRLPGLTVTSNPDADTFGVWGQHGYATVAVVDGAISGSYQGTRFSGDLEYTFALATGDAAGSNPGGLGSATWEGLARAVSTRTYDERDGTATISIADLADPTVSVAIDIDGHAVGSAAWTDIPLTAGHFRAGTQDQDFIDGHFFGPDHSETYGVFDTSAYAGIFAARKQ